SNSDRSRRTGNGCSGSGTTGPASTCSTRISCSVCFSACTPRPNSRAPALGSQRSVGSSPATAVGSGPRAWWTGERRSTSRCDRCSAETPSLVHELPRLRSRRRFGDEPDDRLGVRRPHVEPPIPPRESQPVLRVDLSVGEPLPQRRIGPIEAPLPAPCSPLHLGLYDDITRRGRDDLAHSPAFPGEKGQEQGGRDRRVPPRVERGIHHAPVSFPSDRRSQS